MGRIMQKEHGTQKLFRRVNRVNNYLEMNGPPSRVLEDGTE